MDRKKEIEKLGTAESVSVLSDLVSELILELRELKRLIFLDNEYKTKERMMK